MDNGNCLVTVIVPAYNHEKYIIECLEAIHHQTYRKFQWIVTDDNSSDKTPQILKDKQSEYGYELILNSQNLGVATSMNNMIGRAQGRYIFPCASDDIYLPDRIEKQVSFMESHPQYGMCYSRVLHINKDSQLIGKDYSPKYRSGDLFDDIFFRNISLGACVAMRKVALEKVGCYRAGMIAEDYYLNCRIAELFQIGFLDEYLLKYRVAPVGTKRDPLKLVMSHRETIDFFSYRPEYNKAIKNWELRSGMLLAPYLKYKATAIKYAIKNFVFSSGRDRLLCLIIIINCCIKWWKIKA